MIDLVASAARETVWWAAETLAVAPPVLVLGAAAFTFAWLFVWSVRGARV